ncbi:MAG TPA: hypothetical protein VKP69_08830, partial [Isosphaeraceae bacterium]|nr:hypothetical protein [Isosphaeraceae bacterium]
MRDGGLDILGGDVRLVQPSDRPRARHPWSSLRPSPTRRARPRTTRTALLGSPSQRRQPGAEPSPPRRREGLRTWGAAPRQHRDGLAPRIHGNPDQAPGRERDDDPVPEPGLGPGPGGLASGFSPAFSSG